MCRPEIQPRYASVNRIVDGADTILVCCHNVLIAAPIPFQAPDISCTAVSVCRVDMAADIARRRVISTSTAVYIFCGMNVRRLTTLPPSE